MTGVKESFFLNVEPMARASQDRPSSPVTSRRRSDVAMATPHVTPASRDVTPLSLSLSLLCVLQGNVSEARICPLLLFARVCVCLNDSGKELRSGEEWL